MQIANHQVIDKRTIDIHSIYLERTVVIDCFQPTNLIADPGLLLINDGQNMNELGLQTILEELVANNKISPVLCVGIHAGDRIMEYGTADILDYLGRGYKAGLYRQFILEELIPIIKSTYNIQSFSRTGFAGFSLGGLSAFDIVWNEPQQFDVAGVFSGSFWWRTKSLEDDYNEHTDRIMHNKVRSGKYQPGLKFFFEAGALDETMDRNHNGIIDSIDDTLGLIEELVQKGYEIPRDIHYLELQEGRHDIATWGEAMPEFLKWGWGPETE